MSATDCSVLKTFVLLCDGVGIHGLHSTESSAVYLSSPRLMTAHDRETLLCKESISTSTPYPP